MIYVQMHLRETKFFFFFYKYAKDVGPPKRNWTIPNRLEPSDDFNQVDTTNQDDNNSDPDKYIQK